MSTLSTTQSDSTTAEPDRNTPVTLDGDPVIWDGNPATLKGILEEVKLFYVREGLFQELRQECRPFERGERRRAPTPLPCAAKRWRHHGP